MIDVTFKTYSDANGGDPDATSPTLKRYHKQLWTKPLPNGKLFELSDSTPNAYLSHHTDHGVLYLGSDAITHSYRNQRRKQALIAEVTEDANALFEIGSTIGAYILFPNKQIDRMPTINQARGVNAYIDDRFDLTLECIRRHYLGIPSPLSNTLTRYQPFFELFGDLQGYVDFFLLNDLLDKNERIKFYLPFDEFNSKPRFNNIENYLIYKEGVSEFVIGRNARISAFLNP
jgi:hypothetical protein